MAGDAGEVVDPSFNRRAEGGADVNGGARLAGHRHDQRGDTGGDGERGPTPRHGMPSARISTPMLRM
jgi:hypothetical protein